MHEQLLLRCIHFNIAVEHPHKYLLNFCNLLKVSSRLCQAALCVVNDSLSLTQLCLEHDPATIAAGALQIEIDKATILEPGSWPEHWAQLIGIAADPLQEVYEQLREMYAA